VSEFSLQRIHWHALHPLTGLCVTALFSPRDLNRNDRVASFLRMVAPGLLRFGALALGEHMAAGDNPERSLGFMNGGKLHEAAQVVIGTPPLRIVGIGK
jgi:hypothetical protein